MARSFSIFVILFRTTNQVEQTAVVLANIGSILLRWRSCINTADIICHLCAGCLRDEADWAKRYWVARLAARISPTAARPEPVRQFTFYV